MFPLEGATRHAKTCYPMEAGGLWVLRDGGCLEFIPCDATSTGAFHIPPQKWLEAERAGTIKGIFHSHPNGQPIPSGADLVALEAWGLPWVIMGIPSGDWAQFEPTGRPRPLLGRPFGYGTDDCYGLIRGYYARLGIHLPDFKRWEGWEGEGLNLCLDNYGAAGFVRVDDAAWPETHDLLLLQINSPVPNHCAVYIGDGRILHHLETRLSARAVYGDFYRKATTHVLRYGAF